MLTHRDKTKEIRLTQVIEAKKHANTHNRMKKHFLEIRVFSRVKLKNSKSIEIGQNKQRKGFNHKENQSKHA